jgi:hypothetical protein
MIHFTAKALKTTVILDPSQLSGIAPSPPGSKAIPFAVEVDGRIVPGQFNPKTLRRCIQTAASEEVAVIIQGRLNGANVLQDAGNSAQPKKPKEPAPPRPPTAAYRTDISAEGKILAWHAEQARS